ncbi:ATP-dependent RNA helicase [Xylaria sp. FL1777]|nr:ATP-dependent RNA helicase [Xylaria sp. FL1777]
MISVFASRPICPSCLFTVTTRVVSQSARQPWAAQRLFSAQRLFYERAKARPRPSRMVLSDRVARAPEGDTDSRGGRTPRRRSEGPFGGMNQTFARVREDARQPSRDNPRKSPRDTPRNSPRDARRGGRNPDDGSGTRGPRVKAMKMRGSLHTISYRDRTKAKSRIALESFDQLDLLPSVKLAIKDDALKRLEDIRPTPIQRLAIPALLGQKIGRRSSRSETSRSGRQEFLLAAETGSGKTLAYLVPALNALKIAEAADSEITAYREAFEKQAAAMNEPGYVGPREFEPHPTTARPRVVILVPTAELVDQVGAVVKSLSHAIKFKSSGFSAHVSAKVIQSSMYSPRGIDVVIATPHLLASMADSDPNILSRISHLIVDEADSLFDRSFSSETSSIIDRALPSVQQLILCSATIPKRLDNYLEKQFPNMNRITTPNLHAIPRRVQLGVIDVSIDPYLNNKDLACADAIWSIGKDAARHEGPVPDEIAVQHIMVFVNEREKTQKVADYLVSKGIDAAALHRDTLEQRQSEMLQSFTSAEPVVAKLPDSSRPFAGRRLPNTKVLVATDIASRGIDTLAVRHVILYDVPHTTIDFIHRLGRIGRMGRRARGIVLVGRYDRRDIVAEVRESMYMGQALL